ncbi:hypothetical protein G5V59_04455 [Nocardioides sp. W3-2-3]|uniref:hypothetical protein n=1 Tax=Nocardioides convexus TaxID=2712224 RepID=UPI0024187360|nr:hypothetical protein [Nocardioides convexus]NGZ99820.1 hypothetical protein [Nocardioides convexus]
MSGLPVSARLAWWGTAWLQGRIGPDDLLDAVLGDDVTHVVGGPDGSAPLLLELADARAKGATAIAATFPAPGDPAGLRGPRETQRRRHRGRRGGPAPRRRQGAGPGPGRACRRVDPAARRAPPAARPRRGRPWAAGRAAGGGERAGGAWTWRAWRPEVADESARPALRRTAAGAGGDARALRRPRRARAAPGGGREPRPRRRRWRGERR